MKKRILSIVLSLVLIIGASPMVFADTVSTDAKAELTEEQKTERKAFVEAFENQKNDFEKLKTTEKNLIAENNALAKEIRSLIQGKYKVKAEEVKSIGEQVRDLAKQAKKSNQERLKIKAKGKKTAEDLTAIANKNKDIKSIRDQIASIISRHKQDKEALKGLKAKFQDRLNQEMGLGRLIQEKREEKETYEKDFKADMDKLDYTKAAEDFSKIYKKKQEIVNLLEERKIRLGTLKTDVLSYLNNIK
ncbi:MAG: hypothetical protein WCQ54_02070 [Clostridiaceae bacterium]